MRLTQLFDCFLWWRSWTSENGKFLVDICGSIQPKSQVGPRAQFTRNWPQSKVVLRQWGRLTNTKKLWWWRWRWQAKKLTTNKLISERALEDLCFELSSQDLSRLVLGQSIYKHDSSAELLVRGHPLCHPVNDGLLHDVAVFSDDVGSRKFTGSLVWNPDNYKEN